MSLQIENSKLANQRTYLAYMRTGFLIASIAGSLHKKWITIFGVIMVLFSTAQYILINYDLNSQINPNNSFLDLVPVMYVPFAIIAFFLEFKK